MLLPSGLIVRDYKICELAPPTLQTFWYELQHVKGKTSEAVALTFTLRTPLTSVLAVWEDQTKPGTETMLSLMTALEGVLDKFNIIPNFFQKKLGSLYH